MGSVVDDVYDLVDDRSGGGTIPYSVAGLVLLLDWWFWVLRLLVGWNR